jgi:hypothetical protein
MGQLCHFYDTIMLVVVLSTFRNKVGSDLPGFMFPLQSGFTSGQYIASLRCHGNRAAVDEGYCTVL